MFRGAGLKVPGLGFKTVFRVNKSPLWCPLLGGGLTQGIVFQVCVFELFFRPFRSASQGIEAWAPSRSPREAESSLIMEKEMETTISILGIYRGNIGLYWGYIGMMEKNMEATV